MANEYFDKSISNSDVYFEGGGSSGDTLFKFGNQDGDSYKGAIRFPTVDRSGTVVYAAVYVQQSNVVFTGSPVKFDVWGIDEDNTSDFSSGNPTTRSKTSATTYFEKGTPSEDQYTEVVVTSMFNEIVSRGGWSSGNAMGFIFQDQGSPSDAGILSTNVFEENYLVWRTAAVPDFTPTPKSVAAPSFPNSQNIGIKISQPNQSVLTATDAQLYFTTKRKQFKVVSEAQITTTADPHNITHGQLGIPFADVFVKGGSNWYRLPGIASPFDTHGYYEINSNQLKIYAGVGATVYYYIFLDELD